MKKLIGICIFALFVTALCFAQAAPAGKYLVCYGVVVSVDAATKSVVVKDTKSGKKTTFAAKDKIISKLKTNDNVVVKYRDGSTMAYSIKTVKAIKPKN